MADLYVLQVFELNVEPYHAPDGKTVLCNFDETNDQSK